MSHLGKNIFLYVPLWVSTCTQFCFIYRHYRQAPQQVKYYGLCYTIGHYNLKGYAHRPISQLISCSCDRLNWRVTSMVQVILTEEKTFNLICNRILPGISFPEYTHFPGNDIIWSHVVHLIPTKGWVFNSSACSLGHLALAAGKVVQSWLWKVNVVCLAAMSTSPTQTPIATSRRQAILSRVHPRWAGGEGDGASLWTWWLQTPWLVHHPETWCWSTIPTVHRVQQHQRWKVLLRHYRCRDVTCCAGYMQWMYSGSLIVASGACRFIVLCACRCIAL